MKKLLVLAVLAASMGFSVIGVEAGPNNAHSSNSAAAAGSVQIDRILRQISRRRRHFRNNRNNTNVSYETRTVWKGNKEFRDVYRITWKNGVRHEKRVEHIRIR